MLKNYTKAELLAIFSNAYTTAVENDNRHNKKAYEFAIQLVSSLDDNATLTVRQTTNALNIGDIGECVVKYHLTNKSDVRYSLAGHQDLDRKALNEIKTFSAANRYPNGLEEPSPFIAVSPFGVYHITKTLVNQYWDEFKLDKNNLKTPTNAILKKMIESGARKLEKLSNAIGL